MPGFQPLLIHKDPTTGETWYEFDGVIHLASPNSQARDGNLDSIEWYSKYQQLTAYLASYHYGFMPNGGISPSQWSNNLDIVLEGIATVTGNPNPFPPLSQTDGEPMTFDYASGAAQINMQTGKNGASVNVAAGSQSRKVIDANGASDFAKASFRVGIVTGPYPNSNGGSGPAPQITWGDVIPGNYAIVMWGSGWSQNANTPSGIDMYVNPNGAGANLVMTNNFFFNQANIHTAMNADFWPFTKTVRGTVTVAIGGGAPSGNRLASDSNDKTIVVLIPLP